MPISRRRFIAIAGTAAFAPSLAASSRADQAALTVQDVMSRVLQALGGTAPANTIDGLKAGRADLVVTGIATAPIASVEIIRRAKAAGCNLIVTCEPTFYSRADQASPANRAADPTFAAKRALIAETDVTIWRLRDQWLAQQPAALVVGFAEDLQWQRFQQPDRARVVLPPTSLRELVDHVGRRLDARGLRVVGRPDLRVSRIVLSPGPSPAAVTFTNLASTDVILAGDPREWEGVEYVQDAITAGQPKAMVLVGRLLSENGGMRVLASWLGGKLPGVKIAPLTVTDPYWRPAA
jgi:hypothetical protein